MVAGLVPLASVLYAPTNPYAVPEESLIILLVLSNTLILKWLVLFTFSPKLPVNVAVISPSALVVSSIGLAI